MPDMLIRDLPARVIVEFNAQASRLGISRAELVRRQLLREASRLQQPVTEDDLRQSDDRLHGLLDDTLMERAWR